MSGNWGNNTLAALTRGGTEAISRLLVIGLMLGIAGAIITWISQTLGVSAIFVVIGIPALIALVIWAVATMGPQGNPERRKQSWVDICITKDETSGDIQDDIVRLLRLDINTRWGTRDGWRDTRRGLQEMKGLTVTRSSKNEPVEQILNDIRQILDIAQSIPLNQKIGVIAIRLKIQSYLEELDKPKTTIVKRTKKKSTTKP